jgi:signal transduction histidine kinase
MSLNNLKKLTQNSTLRLAFSYLVVFIFSSLILVAFIYWSSIEYIYKQLDHHIRYDMESIQTIYQHEGKDKVIQTITERLQQQSYDSVYLLYDIKAQKKLAGNLISLPKNLDNGWHMVALDNLSTSSHHQTHSARIIITPLSAQLILINGLDTQSAHQQEHIIINNMLLWIMIIFILGLMGGFIFSINTIKKVSLINTTMQKVGDGNINLRLPIDGSDDEFDLLADNFNQMLARIQILMDKMQNISNNIAHDLRIPLTRIRNHLESIQQKIESETDNKQNKDDTILNEVELSIEETDNLLATFETILNINKFESGIQKLNIKLLSSKKILSDLIDYNEPMAYDKLIKISADQLEDHPFSGDQNMLFLALTNLINNAIKYTPNKGCIFISSRLTSRMGKNQHLETEYLEIVIADNGSGISEQDKSKVFELFYRCEKSRSLPGNGLGLPLVLAVINLHKGMIELDDNQPGLKVSVYLPLIFMPIN